MASMVISADKDAESTLNPDKLTDRQAKIGQQNLADAKGGVGLY